MIISNATTTTSIAPSTLSDVTRANAQPLVRSAQNSQINQQSTVVQLSTQGQMMSRSDRPGSTGESTEAPNKESSESPSIQFMEGEGGGGAAAKTASSGISAYLKTAAA
ncbi:MAG TPA: hypothetical protein VFP33_08940 [Gallionella sp.]|nr:hypothetical protein [Gallionella sp.]